MTVFDEVVSIISNETFHEITCWNCFEMFAINSSPSPLNNTINGIYALVHPTYGVIYIGKGKPITTRIKCHYKATQGKEIAPAWKQFFEAVNTDISVYWYSVDL